MSDFILSIVNLFQLVSKDSIEIIRDAIVALAAASTAIIAFLGLKAWRKQLIGRAQYELARRLLRATYTVRDAIPQLRNIFTTADEHAEAIQEIRKIEPKFRSKGLEDDLKIFIHVYQIRGRKFNEALSDLQIEKLEAEVLWGHKITDVFNPLYDCVRELSLSIQEYLMLRQRGTYSEEEKTEQEKKRFKELHDIVFEISADPEKDPFTAKVQEAIETINLYFRPYLKI